MGKGHVNTPLPNISRRLDIIFRRAEQSIRRELGPYLRSYDLHEEDTLNITLSDTWAANITVTTIITLPRVKVILQHNQAAHRHEFDMIIPDQPTQTYSTIMINQDMIVSTGRENKKHPPHPLIGIEYEPQLTLLNYPEMPIHILYDPFQSAQDFTCKYSHNDNLKSKCDVIMFVPYKYKTMADNTNIEFRTPPVKLEDLPAAIKTEQDKMETLVKEIAKSQGPTGIFLPAYPCTKHVNVSMPECNDELFKYNGCWKQGLHGGRFHINVGYGFREYGKLMTAELPTDDRWCKDSKPILLGYSMAGDVYVRRSELM